MSGRKTIRAWAKVGASAVLVGAALLVVPAAASQAAVACTPRTTSKPFSGFGDNNNYFLVQGGSFEGGATGWNLIGARVVTGNEPWKVGGSAHSSSLLVPPAMMATSPAMCVASDEDSMRFFYKRPGVWGSALHVHIDVTSGVNRATNDLDLDGSTPGWAVSPRMMLPDIRDASGQQTITISFSTRNVPAQWIVDDVYVDPWKTN